MSYPLDYRSGAGGTLSGPVGGRKQFSGIRH